MKIFQGNLGDCRKVLALVDTFMVQIISEHATKFFILKVFLFDAGNET